MNLASPVASNRTTNVEGRLTCQSCKQLRRSFQDDKCYDCYVDDKVEEAKNSTSKNVNRPNSSNLDDVITLD